MLGDTMHKVIWCTYVIRNGIESVVTLQILSYYVTMCPIAPNSMTVFASRALLARIEKLVTNQDMVAWCDALWRTKTFRYRLLFGI